MFPQDHCFMKFQTTNSYLSGCKGIVLCLMQRQSLSQCPIVMAGSQNLSMSMIQGLMVCHILRVVLAFLIGVWLSVREQCYYVVVSVLMTTFSSDVFASFSILPKRYSYSLKYVPDFIFQNMESTSTAHVKIPMLIYSLVFMIYNLTMCHTYLYQKLFGSPPATSGCRLFVQALALWKKDVDYSFHIHCINILN